MSWPWFFSGLVHGLFIGAVVWLVVEIWLTENEERYNPTRW